MKRKILVFVATSLCFVSTEFSVLAELQQQTRIPIYYDFKESYCFVDYTAPNKIVLTDYYISGVYWSGAIFKGDWDASYTDNGKTYNCYMYGGQLHSNS